MCGILSIVVSIAVLAPLAVANTLCYALYRPGCRWVNHAVSTWGARTIFAVLHTYGRLKFYSDYTHAEHLPTQYLVVSNHQSVLDTPALMRYFGYIDAPRLRFVAKRELARFVPLVSTMLKSGRHCLVDRHQSGAQAMQALETFTHHVMRERWLPVIFPEGTRSRNGALRIFHAAGFRALTARLPLPVVVCALDGGWNLRPLLKIGQKLKGSSYRVKVLGVYPAPHNKDEQLSLLREAKALIQAQLDVWRSETTCPQDECLTRASKDS